MFSLILFFFFFNDTATTEIYTLSLHDALPISRAYDGARFVCAPGAGPGGSRRVDRGVRPRGRGGGLRFDAGAAAPGERSALGACLELVALGGGLRPRDVARGPRARAEIVGGTGLEPTRQPAPCSAGWHRPRCGNGGMRGGPGGDCRSRCDHRYR